MRKLIVSVATAGGSILSMVAIATPLGVPVGEAPLSCSTANYSIAAVTGANGEFPTSQLCNPADATQGMCSVYGYKITSLTGATISQSLFAVSADQDLFGTFQLPNGGSAFVGDLGVGDSTTGFLKYARHEYSIRFNSNSTTFEGYIFTKGSSTARIGTAYIRGGKVDESCLIAGPGVPTNQWAPITTSQDVVAAGGKCAATLKYNATGTKVIGITLPQGSSCFTGKIPDDKALSLDGVTPVRDANGPITFGNGTTTVYLPSGYAVCTALPCPGIITYVTK